GEGHLWRARLFLRTGIADQGWWDLDRAAEADPELAVPVQVERLAWGIAYQDTARAQIASLALLRSGRAFAELDTVAALVEAAARQWGPRTAGGLLAGAEAAPWPPPARNRTLLLRAELW